MCSSPSVPKMEKPQQLPPPAPLPTPQQAAPPPVVAPIAPVPVQKQAPLPKQVDAPQAAPPPMLVQGQDMEPVVKRKKSKRTQVQQASKGTSALTIPLNTGVEGGANGGLNIPTAR